MKNQRLTRGIIVLVVLIFVLVYWLATPSRSIVLPDGAELELKAITHGTRHIYPNKGLRSRLLSSMPDRFWKAFGIKRKILIQPTLNTDTTNLVLWLERLGTTPPILMLCDEDGHAAAPVSRAAMSGGVDDEALEAWSFPVWPRRSRVLTLRIYGQTNSTDAPWLVGDCGFRNPAPGDAYPTWRSEPLPITKQAGNLSFSLTEFLVGVDGRSSHEARPSGDPTEAWVSAVFRVTQAGVPTDEWVPAGIVTMDATGNRLQNVAWNIERGPQRVYYRWGLWPGEAAWKLQVEFSRRSGFAPGQLWTVKGLSLTETNLSGNKEYQTVLQGITVRLQALSPARSPDGSRTLHMALSPRSDDRGLSLVEGTDDQGRPVSSGSVALSGGGQLFNLTVAPDAKSLNLTFALHESHVIEFTVKPEVAGAILRERPQPIK